MCGGGAFNLYLLQRLQAGLPWLRVSTSDQHGLPPLQVEAADRGCQAAGAGGALSCLRWLGPIFRLGIGEVRPPGVIGGAAKYDTTAAAGHPALTHCFRSGLSKIERFRTTINARRHLHLRF